MVYAPSLQSATGTSIIATDAQKRCNAALILHWRAELAMVSLVPHSLKLFERFVCDQILTIQLQRSEIMVTGLSPFALVLIHPSQIEVGIAIGFVARSANRSFEPGHRGIPVALLDQICADVVIGISEFRIDFDGLQAFRYGLLEVTLKRISPSAEGVGLSRGECLDRVGVEFDRLLELSFYLVLEGSPEVFFGPLLEFALCHIQMPLPRVAAGGRIPFLFN